MALVTGDEVLAIMDNPTITSPEVDAYISGAEALMDAAFASTTLNAASLKEIQRWLTAHMIAMTRERMSKKEEAGSAKIEYIGVYGAALDATPYGQMVKVYDTTGALAALGGKAATSVAIKSFNS